VGTEIQTFTSLKGMADYIETQSGQYKSLYEDYSQWLGTILRSAEDTHKNEDWYQKSAAMQKNLKTPSAKKAPEPKGGAKSGKAKGKGGKKPASSSWIESGNILISSSEQGQIEMLFEAIDKINVKMLELDKFKASMQQLERIGLGKNTNYIVFIEDDVPKKIYLRTKNSAADLEVFKFATEFSTPGIYAFGSE
jgi:hypothetical protein